MMSQPIDLTSSPMATATSECDEREPQVHWKDVLYNAERLLPTISTVLGTDESKMNESMAIAAHVITDFCLVKTVKTYVGAHLHLGIEMRAKQMQR